LILLLFAGVAVLATFYMLIIDDYSFFFNWKEIQIADSRAIDENTTLFIHGAQEKNQ
jgi:hypothetical protein